MNAPLWQLVDETKSRVEAHKGWSFTCLNAKGEWKARKGHTRAVGSDPEELLREIGKVNGGIIMSILDEKLEQTSATPGGPRARLDQIYGMWGDPKATKHRTDGMVLEVQRKTMDGNIEVWRRVVEIKDSLFEKVEG